MTKAFCMSSQAFVDEIGLAKKGDKTRRNRIEGGFGQQSRMFQRGFGWHFILM